MGVLVLTLAAIVVLAVVAFRRAPDTAVVSSAQAKWLLIIALVVMGGYALFLLYFGVAEMISGDAGGLIHLVPAILLAVLVFLAWRRPVEAGVVLVIMGVLASLYYGAATMQGGGPFRPASLLGGLPYLAAGLILLAAVALARRK